MPELAVADGGVNPVSGLPTDTICIRRKSSARQSGGFVGTTLSFSKGEEGRRFFGRQTVYHHEAQVAFPYAKAVGEPYKLV